MTDKEKLDAIRAEIHRLVDVRGYDREMANDLFAFMDSLPNEPVSEELIDVAKQYVKEHVIGIDKITFSIATDMFISGAKWQIAKLMANATEVTAHMDAGGYPYIPQIELYDYDKDVPLAKEGDKYKVILIKEG